MVEIPLMPLAGMNNVAEDPALQIVGNAPRLYVREALNVNVTPQGKAELRKGVRRVTDTVYRNLWQSPLHGDTFGTLGDSWVRVDPLTWSHEVLATVGEGPVSHVVLNNQVCVAAPAGIFTFDGTTAQRLTLDTPAAPLVLLGDGSLSEGTYGVAVAWLRGDVESALSPVTSRDVPEGGRLEISLPMSFDPSVTGARLYLTRQNGGELLRAGDHSLSVPTILVPLLPDLGRAAEFRHLSPMPAGKFLKYWRGRLLTATRNVLRWSEPLAYHLHDERHGFVLLPQRITFVQPVDGGIWVGQVDHVVFLEGSSPDSLSVTRKTSQAPVPGSAILVKADALGGEMSQGGSATAVWLAENGYVAGTASGQMVELHAGALRGIIGQAGTSVVLDRRIVTIVT